MAAVLRETNAIGRRLGFELADDVEERLGFFRDKPTRPSLLKDFELGREPELASGVLVFDVLAKGDGGRRAAHRHRGSAHAAAGGWRCGHELDPDLTAT